MNISELITIFHTEREREREGGREREGEGERTLKTATIIYIMFSVKLDSSKTVLNT